MKVDTLSREELRLQAAVGVLLSEAMDQGIDKRNVQREPYFKKVTIQIDSGSVANGFIREISNEGVGLLHAFPLKPKDSVIVVVGSDRTPFRLQVEITWCESVGEGWYISGGQFVARLDS